MSGRNTSPAAHVGRRVTGLVLLCGLVLGTAARSHAQDALSAWERIGDRPHDMDGVSFDPGGTLWQNDYYVDSLDIRRDPNGPWQEVQRYGFYQAPIFFSPDTLIAGGVPVKGSTDRLRTVQDLPPEYPGAYRPPPGASYRDRVLLGDTGRGVAYSDDRGATFTQAQSPDPNWAAYVRSWTSMPGNAGSWGSGASVRLGRIFAGSLYAGICYSDDGGAAWVRSGLWGGYRIRFVTLLERPPEQGGGVRIIAAGEGAQLPDRFTQIWASDDAGATFRQVAVIETPVGRSSLQALLPVVPGMASGASNSVPSWTTREALIVMTEGAVYRTTDGGLTWAQIPGEAGQVPLPVDNDGDFVTSATLGPDGRLYPSTAVGGPDQSWPVRSTAFYGIVAGEDAPADEGVAVGPVVPNPASGRASLTLTLAEPSHVTVDVFDVLGRAVRTDVGAAMPAGTSAVALDVSGLPPGVYLARVVVLSRRGASAVTRRFTVAR